MGEHHRLCPTMSSRKLQALDFIKRYFAQWGYSPTLGEIAAELEVSTKRAHDLVHALARDGLIEHIPGKTRGIRLLERSEELSEADVLLRLAAMGWTIGHGGYVIKAPRGQGVDRLSAALLTALMEKGLPDLPELDHDPAQSGKGSGSNAADQL